MRTLKFVALGLVAATCLQFTTPAQAIDAVRGKQYHLTTKHGPWMIMVTSFQNVRDKKLKTDGLTAQQAAAELVFELREKGIPAYTFSQDAIKGEIDTRDRLGRDDHRIYAAQRDMICVLAGNYESIEDTTGEKTLKIIKKFQPKFLKDTKNGAIVRANAAPLSGAFLTINPLIKPEDVALRSVDKETKYLNTGIAHALVNNPHKYTIQVATFAGKSATPIGNSLFRGKVSDFDQNLRKSTNIVRAGEDAGNLVDFLRKNKGKIRAESQFADAGIDEAYVYHEKFQSIVTIGGFDSPDDPRIRLIMQHYGPQLVPDIRLLNAKYRTPEARRSVPQDEIDRLPKIFTTHTEQFFRKPNPGPDELPDQVWTFDTEPKVIPVPRLK